MNINDAWLLGAGDAKVASILNTSTASAKIASKTFTESISGLQSLKESKVPLYAKRGFFVGLDGRRVKVPSQHKVLAGMLQNGESCIMKHAALKWTREVDLLGIQYKLVTWPHDEWQTETYREEEAEKVGEVQRQAIASVGDELGLFCPMSGSTEIGINWFETH